MKGLFAKLNKRLNNKRGQVLIFVYAVFVILTVVAASFLGKAVNDNHLARRQRLQQEAFYLAEGGIEDALWHFADDIANFLVAADIAIWPAQPDPPVAPPIYHNTVYASFFNATVESLVERLEAVERPIDAGGGASGWARNYRITSTVVHPLNSAISATAVQHIERQVVPAFQHAVFYDLDLEILPGPNMTFNGRIHSNQDIYIDSNNSLTVDSFYLKTAGSIYNHRKNGGAAMPGSVDIRITDDPMNPPTYAAMAGLDSDDPSWTATSQIRWAGTVQSAVHGVTSLAVPAVQSIDPGGYYASNADVVITNNTVVKAGVALVPGVDMPNDTVTDSSTFYNNREASNVRMTDLNLQRLAGYADQAEYDAGTPSFPNHLPDNGLLYATRDDAIVGEQPGVRLMEAGDIERDAGLTVVSNDPVYVQGDYNDVDKKPCAIICDSVNVLSSAWNNDADSLNIVNNRPADDTTINSAFIAGIDDTVGAAYNGGLENYPRMHESWSGDTLFIRGSFLAIWNSQVATGPWVYGNPQYKAPTRDWDYDDDFNDLSKLPPFTPWAVEINRVSWEQ